LIDIVDFLNRKFAEQKDFENITPFMNDLWLSANILTSYIHEDKAYISKNTIILLINNWYTFDF
jgi:hypothetical protein